MNKIEINTPEFVNMVCDLAFLLADDPNFDSEEILPTIKKIVAFLRESK
jgi:hypothetical protein